MPRDAITLADVHEPTLTIVCERCGRYGRYDVKRLIAAHGADAKLTDLLAAYSRTRAAYSRRSLPACDASSAFWSSCLPKDIPQGGPIHWGGSRDGWRRGGDLMATEHEK
jgi:hypothetical protein